MLHFEWACVPVLVLVPVCPLCYYIVFDYHSENINAGTNYCVTTGSNYSFDQSTVLVVLVAYWTSAVAHTVGAAGTVLVQYSVLLFQSVHSAVGS